MTCQCDCTHVGLANRRCFIAGLACTAILPMAANAQLSGPPTAEDVTRELARYWEFQHGASKWRSLDFYKLGKVQTLRLLELCEKYGFTDGTETPVKAQMLPLQAWPSGHRAELQRLLEMAAS